MLAYEGCIEKYIFVLRFVLPFGLTHKLAINIMHRYAILWRTHTDSYPVC